MRIEVLYFEDCPNYLPALDRLRAVLREEGMNVDVVEVEVRDAWAAERLQFIGSPTIRINGLDIDTGARTLAGVGFACRRYAGGLPSETMIRAALRSTRGLKECKAKQASKGAEPVGIREEGRRDNGKYRRHRQCPRSVELLPARAPVHDGCGSCRRFCFSVRGQAVPARCISSVYRVRVLSGPESKEVPTPSWRNQLGSFVGVRRIRISLDFLPAGDGQRSGQPAGTVIS